MNSFRSFFFRNDIPSLREFLSSNEYFERSRTKFRRKGKEGAFRLKGKSNFKWLLYYCNSAHRSTRTSKYRSRAFSSRIDCIYSWAVILPLPSPPPEWWRSSWNMQNRAVNYSTQFSRLLSRGSDYPIPAFPAFLINAAHTYLLSH